jgi:tetratricopeptide (TPR) repeat protein
MTSLTTTASIDETNQRALATLARSITVSQGRFALSLVRCNYTALRHRLMPQLKAASPVQIQEITLSRNLTNLWLPLANAAAHQKQRALMVYGLEDVENLVDLLQNLDTEQDKLTALCQIPVVLWLTEESLSQLVRLAPGFYASTVTAITLRSSTSELEVLWRESSDRLFGELVDRGVENFVSNQDIGFCEKSKVRRELQAATRDLKNLGSLPSALTATWQFILGRDEDDHKNMGEALVRYQRSLNIWGKLQEQVENGDLNTFTIDSVQMRWAMVKLHMGQCYYRQSQLAGSFGHPNLQLAKDTFLSVVRIFARQQRFDLCCQVMTLAGKTLCALGHWLELENIANSVLSEEDVTGHPLNQAQAHGFLAEVALHHNNFDRALEQSKMALALTQETEEQHSSSVARYLLQIAKVEARSGDFTTALPRLQKAQKMVSADDDLQLYLDIMQEQRLLQYHTGQFWEAFQIKQQQQILRYQRGLSAFVGTTTDPEQLAIVSIVGREEDIAAMVDRLHGEQPLTILHGENGIGKSSLLQSGVLPALNQQLIAGHHPVVVIQNRYHDWQTVLWEAILQASGRPVVPGAASINHIRRELDINIRSDLVTILLFDHFEDFFLAVLDVADRREFFQFFGECLASTQVKICISIRQESLHELLEIEQSVDLSSIGNNILDRNLRYQLRNFSLEQARSTIDQVTGNCRYYLEPALAEQLVSDLANDQSEIPPLQLQVIGAQLQAENVRTIAQYLQLGRHPHQYLMERALEESIRDCGRNNQVAVLNVLYLLTSSLSGRPCLAFSQLLTATAPLSPREHGALHQSNHYAQLLLLLNILVGSGVVSCRKYDPENRYQLIHEDLVETIRLKYEALEQPVTRTLSLRMRVNNSYAWRKFLDRGLSITQKIWSSLRSWQQRISNRPEPRVLPASDENNYDRRSSRRGK